MPFTPVERVNLRIGQRRDQIHAGLMAWGRENPRSWTSILDCFRRPPGEWTKNERDAIFALAMMACHDLGRDLSAELRTGDETDGSTETLP